jgi:hypothetical protein
MATHTDEQLRRAGGVVAEAVATATASGTAAPATAT